ncbi:hypothetical protein JNUCC42_21350 [Brevibacterium sp. JNUCC-42]|nr:hypothetical protein JNUCC42_21350 [Brevibacterium sp. JNUCC-42]
MKRISLSALALLTTLSMSTSAFALTENNSNPPIKQSAEYTYNYNGITFTGLSPLKENQLQSMYKSLVEGKTQKIIPDGPGGAEIIHGPECTSYDHSIARSTAKFILAYLAVAVPAPIKNWQKAGMAWLLDTLTGWSQDAFQDTHVGYWDWKVRDSDDKVDIYYVTIVRYKDNTFKKVIDVQYYEADRVRYK